LAIAVASFLWTITLQTRAVPEDDVFQQAVNYVFTGKIDPGTALLQKQNPAEAARVRRRAGAHADR
jgi:C-terminal processing protease CtpA/Prc